MVKIHKIPEGRLDAECHRIEMPRRAGLHLNRKGANSSHIGITAPDLFLKLDRLLKIFLLLKRTAHGEKEVAEDLLTL